MFVAIAQKLTRRAIVPFAMLALAATSQAAPFAIIMTNGRTVEASSRPFIAMGTVSFLDAQGKPTRLDSKQVDVAATRARSKGPDVSGRVWTGDSMKSLGNGVQFVDTPGAGESDAQEDNSSSPETEGTEVDKLRARIASIDAEARKLPPTDRQRSLLVFQRMELQEDLARMLGSKGARN